MTSPTSVGSVSIEIVAEAKGLAKKLRKDVEGALKGLDVGKMLRETVGRSKPVKVPIEPEFNTKDIPEKVKRTRVPKVPVEVDPLLNAFQQQVRRQVAALSRSLNANVPVGADTSGLRAQMGAQLAEVQRQSRLEVPTEPGSKVDYEAKLKAQLAEVARRVKQTVHVDVDVDKGRSGSVVSAIGGLLKGLGQTLPNIGGIATGLADLGGAMQKLVGSSAQLGGNLVGAFEAATGPIGIVVGLLVAVSLASTGMGLAIAGGASVGISAVAALAGAIAAIPAALAGVGAGVGTLLLGFKGISEAFEPKSGGGGGGGGADPAQRARQVASAERGVEAARRGIASATRALQAAERGLVEAEQNVGKAELAVADAQRRALQAQQAVSRARREAAEDIDDLGRALRGAVISENEAAQAVHDAQLALNEAKLTGDIPAINRASNAYDRAVLSLEEAKDTTQDLGEEQADSARKGVEGSDKVQQALESQQDALRGVTDAQEGVRKAQEGVLNAQNAVLSANDGLKASYDGLASAQDSLASAQTKMAAGAGGVAKEVTKLAPAAQRFVDAIKALKPAFEDLRLDVQQRLFAGLDKTVTNVGKAWIPALKTTLGSYADTFNGFFKNLGTAITTPKFITDMQAGAEGFRQLLDKLGASITSKLVPAFGALSNAAGPFLSKLGDELALIVTKFSDWVLAGEKSGGLTTFFDKAAEAMHDLFETGTQVGRIIGSVISIITGSQASAGTQSPLDTFNAALKRLADWLANPENQAKVQSFIVGIENAVNKVAGAIQTVSGWVETLNSWGQKFEEFKARIGLAIDGVVDYFQALPDRVVGFIQALPDRVSAIFSNLATRAGQIIGYGLGVVARFFYDLPGKIWGFIKSIPDRISSLWNNIVSIAKSLPGRISAAVDSLRNLPSRIWGFFSGLPNMLWNAGMDAIRGLWNGITSMGNWLRDKIHNFASGIIQGFKAGFDSNSPSKRMAREVGVTLPQGMSVGILAGRRDLLRDVDQLADDVAAAAMLPALPSPALALGADMDAAISRNLSVVGKQQVTVRWEDGVTADPILRAFRDLIRLSFNGDVQAAFG